MYSLKLYHLGCYKTILLTIGFDTNGFFLYQKWVKNKINYYNELVNKVFIEMDDFYHVGM